MRRRARVDDNQGKLVSYLRAHGVSVLIVSAVPGALDLVLGYMGVDGRAEIKDGSKSPSRRRLTELEQYAVDTWAGRPIVTLEGEADCDLWMQEVRAQALANRIARRRDD